MPDPSLEEMARNRIPLKRFGTPREIADAAVFLMSDGAGYVTGWLDGPLLARPGCAGGWSRMESCDGFHGLFCLEGKGNAERDEHVATEVQFGLFIV